MSRRRATTTQVAVAVELGAPWALALLGFLPVIAWLHRLRRPASALRVPSLEIWRRLAGAPRPRRSRLRASLVLLLHLAAAAALAVGASGLRFRALDDALVVVVLDTSPSMGSQRRWPEAVAAVRALADAHPRLALVEVSDSPRLRVLPTARREVIDAALGRLRPLAHGSLERAPDMAGALAMARALSGPAGQVVVVSDGGIQAPSREDGLEALLWLVGSPAPNWSISAARLRRQGGQPRLFVRVDGPAGDRATRRLIISADDRSLEARPVELGPDGHADIVVPVIGVEGRGELIVALEPGDGWGGDDAWRIASPLARRRLQLVGAPGSVASLLTDFAGLDVLSAGPASLRPAADVDLTLWLAAPPSGPLPGPAIRMPRPAGDVGARFGALAWDMQATGGSPPLPDGRLVPLRPDEPSLPGGRVLATVDGLPAIELALHGEDPVLAIRLDAARMAAEQPADLLALVGWATRGLAGSDDGPFSARDAAQSAEADLTQGAAEGWPAAPRLGRLRSAAPMPWRWAALAALALALAEGFVRARRAVPRSLGTA